MQRACMHAQGDADNSNRPANTSVTQELPASGTITAHGGAGKAKDQTDVSDTHMHAEGCECFKHTCKRVSNVKNPGLTCYRRRTACGEPKRLESPTDASDVCTRMPSVVDGSRRPTHMPERVRKSQDDSGNNTHALRTCTHSQNGRIDAIMAAIRAEEVSGTPKKQSATKRLTNVARATYKPLNTLHAQVCVCLHEYR